MNNEVKHQYMENIQKDITHECIKPCFSLQTNKVDQQCFQSCYIKYINVLQTTSERLKHLGYKNQSAIAYKIYPEFDPYTSVIYSDEFMRLPQQIGLAQDAANNRSA